MEKNTEYYESLDKRTKEYKEYKKWKNSQPSEGLGDTIEKLTKATGIKKAVDWFSEKTGIDCGCDARKEKLNKMFRYDTPECLNKEEYKYLHTFFNTKRSFLKAEEQNELLKIHNRIFKGKIGFSNCSPCVKGLISKLERVYKEYDGGEPI